MAHLRRRSAFALFLLLLIAGTTALTLMPSGRRIIDIVWRKTEQIERETRYRMGMRLRGTPDLEAFDRRLTDRGVRAGNPVFIRIFKAESELELWIRRDDRYVLFATYPICRWSGGLGPKLKEGDRQAPEGFYSVGKSQLNPNSRWHRAFNLGFPNAFDRANGRTGSALMVHGGCSSVGCYAMTDPVIDEIWRLVTAAIDDGQPSFDVHVFPFRVTGWNISVHAGKRWETFWDDLKQGYDAFEATRRPPTVKVCSGRYLVDRQASGEPPGADCPPAFAAQTAKSTKAGSS